MFNLGQIKELMGVIDFYHTLFIGTNIGKDTLTKNDINTLKSRGIDVSKMPDESIADYSYKFGILSEALGSKRSAGMNFDELKNFIASKNYIPLTSAEKATLEYVKHQMYSDIKGLGNRVSKDFSQTAIEIDRKRRLLYEKTIKDETAKIISQRKSVNELASELGHKTGDWARDFDRIADYTMHNAYQHGIASQMIKMYGEDCNVFYSVYERACPHCVRIYLTDGVGSEPKHFKLKDILANGSNIGRKTTDWLPSVSPLHPWCRCTMNLIPENGIWDKDKKRFVIKRNTYGVERKSKIKVTIG